MAEVKPSRPRILTSTAHKYVGRKCTIIGEVINMNSHAKTLTVRMPDDETMFVLLQNNSTTIEPHLLTEASGLLVSKGQVEADWIKQWNQKESAMFNKALYKEALAVMDGLLSHLDV